MFTFFVIQVITNLPVNTKKRKDMQDCCSVLQWRFHPICPLVTLSEKEANIRSKHYTRLLNIGFRNCFFLCSLFTKNAPKMRRRRLHEYHSKCIDTSAPQICVLRSYRHPRVDTRHMKRIKTIFVMNISLTKRESVQRAPSNLCHCSWTRSQKNPKPGFYVSISVRNRCQRTYLSLIKNNFAVMVRCCSTHKPSS